MTASPPKVGLLGLYIELYDRIAPEIRPRINSFYDLIAEELGSRGVEVVTSPVCCVRPEFELAIKSFEGSAVDAIVTLHLAYSPSLESAEVLSKTLLPIIVLDTTPSYSFGPSQNCAELMFNHGIHGVQDMCNLLKRGDKSFHIEAGHWEKSDVLDRVVDWARAARLASTFRNQRIGLIGQPMKGMGDFLTDTSALGIETVPANPALLRSLLPAEDAPEVNAEMEQDLRRFEPRGVDPEAHVLTTRACLAVRRWIERENLTGFTFNFDDIDESSGLPTVPFLEASKAMARGIGYAGEGDVLTAALVGSLASIYPETTFAEMFCPDWENQSIFISHMGEMNVDLCDGKPELIYKPIPFLRTPSPVLAVGRFKGGEATLVNAAPGSEGTLRVHATEVEMLRFDTQDCMSDMIRGWFRLPGKSEIAGFLKDVSMAGGTHHWALVYGSRLEVLKMSGFIDDRRRPGF